MDPTLEELINGRPMPAPLPNVNPQGLVQAGSNMSTMGAVPNQGQMDQAVRNPQPQPPATPEEFNARKNGWMQMMQQLRADPSVQQAVMFTAARLLQGQKFGQSVGGALGEAAFGGMSMYNQLQENASEQQLKQREAERRDQLVGAQTEDLRSQVETRRAKAPLDLRKMDLELRKIETEVQRMEDPASLENNKRLLENLIMAYSNQEIEDNPELAKRVARAALLKQEVENTYKERQGSAAVTRAATGGGEGGATAAVVQGRRDLYERLKRIHPEWGPQQLESEVLKREGTAKAKPTQQQQFDLRKQWAAEQDNAYYAGRAEVPFKQWVEENFPEFDTSGLGGSTEKPATGGTVEWTRDSNGKPVRKQ